MSREVKMTKSTGNVFRDLGYPDPEARNLMMRSDLLIAIEKLVNNCGLTQSIAAKQLGLTQSRLNQLLRGHLDRFSLDALVEIATRAGLEVRLSCRMSKNFKSIRRGLNQAIAHQKGKRVPGLVMHTPTPAERKRQSTKRRVTAAA